MDPSFKFLSILLSITIAACVFSNAEARDIGVNYGMLGDNLPTSSKVVSLCKLRNIDRLRLFDPDPRALRALHGSGIEVVLGTLNQDLERLAGDQSAAAEWVAINVAPHAHGVHFRYITAGNEVIPGGLAHYVLPAMRNMDAALRAANFSVPVTTVVSTEVYTHVYCDNYDNYHCKLLTLLVQVLGASYPPSQGAFLSSVAMVMTPIVAFLRSNGYPILINVYPYFAYASNPKSVPLPYALFTAKRVVVQDGQLGYWNLFDAIVDAMYSALEKSGGGNVKIVVSETGWPSGGGGNGATAQNARTYNNNVVRHVRSRAGTPRRPWRGVEAYLFAMFNENTKPVGVEQNFGLYHPNMTEVYHIEF